MKGTLEILLGCMCLMLYAGIVKSTEDPLELSDSDEFDNSVRGIIGDGLSLTGNDASASDSGSNGTEQEQQENRNSSIPPPMHHPRILPPHLFILTPPMLPPNVNQPVAARGHENKSTDTARTAESQSTQPVSTSSSSTPHSTSTLASTTDERRIFIPVNPLSHLFTAGNVNAVTSTTTSTSTTTTSAKPNVSKTPAASNHTNEETTFRSQDANSTNLWSTSSQRNRSDDTRGIITPPTKTAFTIDDTLRCGYPPISDPHRCRVLNISSGKLESCEIPGAKGGFIFMIVFLALVIIVGNSMLPIIVWRNRDMRAPHNFMKVSLAVADGIVGFVLLFSVVPNVVRTMESTEVEVVRMIKLTTNSPQAVVAGAMITLSAQASLFHLTYLSIERFVAIKWPLWHRFKARGSLKIHVALIWTLSIVAAFIPAAFPQSFLFTYAPTLFVYMLSTTGSNHVTVGTIYLVVTMVIPFLISVVLTAATGIVVWRKMRSTSSMQRYSTRNSRWTQRTSTQSGDAGRSKRGTKSGQKKGAIGRSTRGSKSNGDISQKELKPEVAVFKTTMIMIAAFCITLLPFITVALLFYAEYFDCLSYPVPFAAAFYACLSNSFINVLIYTARDRKFRGGWKKIMKLSRNRRWLTGTWKSQKTKSSSVQMSQRPGHYATSTESSKDKCEQALVKH